MQVFLHVFLHTFCGVSVGKAIMSVYRACISSPEEQWELSCHVRWTCEQMVMRSKSSVIKGSICDHIWIKRLFQQITIKLKLFHFLMRLKVCLHTCIHTYLLTYITLEIHVGKTLWIVPTLMLALSAPAVWTQLPVTKNCYREKPLVLIGVCQT